MDSFKHSIITALASVFGGYLAHKLPGVDQTAATAFFAALCAHLFHVKLYNDALNTPPPGDGA